MHRASFSLLIHAVSKLVTAKKTVMESTGTEDILAPESKSLANLLDFFRKNLSFLTRCARDRFLPQCGKAWEIFGVIVCRSNFVFLVQYPQSIHFVGEAAGQFTGTVRPFAALGRQADETRSENVLSVDRGRYFGQKVQTL